MSYLQVSSRANIPAGCREDITDRDGPFAAGDSNKVMIASLQMDSYSRCRAWLSSSSGQVAWLLFCGLVSFAVSFTTSCIVVDPLYCSSNAECVQEGSSSPMQVCHPSKHTCVPFPMGTCFFDSDCTSPTASRCDTTANKCVACRVGDPSDKSCESLGLGGKTQCIEVSGVAQCIECQANQDCPSDRPICDGSSCRACREHKDCEGTLNCEGGVTCTDSMVCIREGDLPEGRAGSCAWNGPGSTGRVVYAHNANAGCSDTDPAFGFRFNEPVCNLTRAFTLARDTGRRYIRVLGANYDPVNAPISYANFSFIGAPGKSYPTMATMKGRGLLFDVRDTGRLTIEQLDMTEQNVDTTALICTGNGIDKVAGLWLWRSIVRGSTTPAFLGASKPAISLNDCSTRIEQNIIGVTQLSEATMPSMAPAHGGGISISDKGQNTKTGYNIENNLIAGNISTAIDLLSSLSPRVLIRFNTVAYNGRQSSGRVGGISCRPLVMSKAVVSNNIFFGNLTVAASQISYADGCAFADTVVGSADSCAEQGLRKNNPEFDANFALSDSTANRTCCIDQVTPAVGESYPLLDLRYLTRPSGKSYDIGAFELQQTK